MAISQDFLTEIENTEATESDIEAARKFLGRFTYTATALVALHMAMRELERDLGDENTEAGELLLHCAGAMARIDAAVS
jgi:hypothetical protein